MDIIVSYGSKYDSAKKYAEMFSKTHGLSIFSYKDLKTTINNDWIIHFGALYAGGILGLKHIASSLSNHTKLVIVTIGLADVKDKQNIKNITRLIKSAIPENVFNNAYIFHLRGAINYHSLSLKHRAMMAFLYAKAKHIREEQQNEETKELKKTYGKQVSFVSEQESNNLNILSKII